MEQKKKITGDKCVATNFILFPINQQYKCLFAQHCILPVTLISKCQLMLNLFRK